MPDCSVKDPKIKSSYVFISISTHGLHLLAQVDSNLHPLQDSTRNFDITNRTCKCICRRQVCNSSLVVTLYTGWIIKKCPNFLP